MSSDGKEPKLGSSNQETSQSAGKNTGVVLIPCLHGSASLISNGMDISEVPGCHELSVRVTKITSRIGVS